jgi:hypothetical protein
MVFVLRRHREETESEMIGKPNRPLDAAWKDFYDES